MIQRKLQSIRPRSSSAQFVRRSNRARNSILSTILLALLFAASGCDDTVIDPFANDGNYFTVYGFLDERATRHSVRVIPVTRSAERIESPDAAGANIDAVVTSVEMESDVVLATHQWSHSLVQLDDGFYGHIFSANFIVTAGRSYRVTITRKDGKTTSATTKVPNVVDRDVLEIRPLKANSDSTVFTQEIVSSAPVDAPWEISAIYTIEGGRVNRGALRVPYGRSGLRTEDGRWILTLNPTADRPAIDAVIQQELDIGRLEPGDDVYLTAMGVTYKIPDANWPLSAAAPGGGFEDVPDFNSNVDNGYGFFGSVGYYTEEWNAVLVSVMLGFD